MSEILDSGERRSFETGAVRDIQEGKGRCDLMPLDIVDAVVHYFKTMTPPDSENFDERILSNIVYFKQNHDYNHLLDAICVFMWVNFDDFWTGFLEISVHFEEGAKKYGENNWQKGIPVHCYIDSAMRHFFKYMRGDGDERHDRAFCWNLICCIWTILHAPELDDFSKKSDKIEAKTSEFDGLFEAKLETEA